MPWRRVLQILLVYGFLKELHPSQSFMTKYLVSPHKNFTKEEVNQEIYPIGTYSCLCLSLVIFLLVDLFHYKPILVVQALSGVLVYALLLWTSSLFYMQIVEVFYGLFVACDVAYSAYIYGYCDQTLYQKVTSYVHIAQHLGKFLSGVIAQIFISYNVMNYHELNYISLFALLFASVVALPLPRPQNSMFFHCKCKLKEKNDLDIEVNPREEAKETFLHKESNAIESPCKCDTEKSLNIVNGFKILWSCFKKSYNDIYVVKWSIWWSLTLCGYLQSSYYIQNLWQETVDASEGQQLYNGLAGSIYIVIGIVSAWLVSLVSVNLKKISEQILSICAISAGMFLVVASRYQIIWVQYVMYGGFRLLYGVAMILANSEVAKTLPRDSHALVFGFNASLALFLQTILTLVVTAKRGLELNAHSQFLVYGFYYIVIGFIFMTFTVGTYCRDLRRKNRDRPENTDSKQNELTV